MNIVRGSFITEYRELRPGDVFTYGIGAYIKINEGYALRLDSEYSITERFNKRDYVCKIPAESIEY